MSETLSKKFCQIRGFWTDDQLEATLVFLQIDILVLFYLNLDRMFRSGSGQIFPYILSLSQPPPLLSHPPSIVYWSSYAVFIDFACYGYDSPWQVVEDLEEPIRVLLGPVNVRKTLSSPLASSGIFFVFILRNQLLPSLVSCPPRCQCRAQLSPRRASPPTGHA